MNDPYRNNGQYSRNGTSQSGTGQGRYQNSAGTPRTGGAVRRPTGHGQPAGSMNGRGNTGNAGSKDRLPRGPYKRETFIGSPRPGIKTYPSPKNKNDRAKWLTVAIIAIIAIALTVIIAVTSHKNFERLPDPVAANEETTAEDGTSKEVTTEEITEPPETEPATYNAARTDATVTLSDELVCEYGFLIDVESNTVIAEKNGTERIYPASMTKVMTALVAFEHCPDLSAKVAVSNQVIAPLAAANASVAGFYPGEEVTVLDLLYGVALPSGADATGALAEYISGSEAEFAVLMNEKCKELKLEGTHFVNASGLHDPEHYSTCSDIAVIFKTAMENDTLREIFSTYQYTTSKTPQHPDGILLTDTMFSRIQGSEEFDWLIDVLAGKTGYTEYAGQCLVSLARVGATGKEFIYVSAKGQTKWKPIADTIWIYRHYLGVTYDSEFVFKSER